MFVIDAAVFFDGHYTNRRERQPNILLYLNLVEVGTATKRTVRLRLPHHS